MNYGYVNFGNGTRIYYIVLIFICIFVCVATFINSKNYYNALGNEDENTDYGFSKSGLKALLTFNIILFVIGVIALCVNFVFLVGTFFKYKEEIEEPVPKDNDIGTILGIERKIAEEFNIRNEFTTLTSYGEISNEETIRLKKDINNSLQDTVKDIAVKIYRRGGISFNNALEYSKYLVNKVVEKDTKNGKLIIKRFLTDTEYNNSRKEYKQKSEELIGAQDELREYEKKIETLGNQKNKLDKNESNFRVQEYKFDSQIREYKKKRDETENNIKFIETYLPEIKNKLLTQEDKINFNVAIDKETVKEKIYDTNINIFKKFMYYITNKHEGIGAEQDTLNEIISS